MIPGKQNSLATMSPVGEMPEADGHISQAAGELRTAESVVLGFLVYTTVASLELPMSARERLTIIALNVLTTAVIFLLARVTPEKPRSFLVAVRDWLPAPLILLAYRESGVFFTPDPAHRLDHVFVRWDSFLLQNKWVVATLSGLAPWPQCYLELAYLFCYPIVPLGLGCLLLRPHRSGRQAKADSLRFAQRRLSLHCASNRMTATPQCRPDRSKGSAFQSKTQDFKSRIVVDHFWTAVLIATMFCYAVYPFFPLTPPRLLFHDLPGPPGPPFLRMANLWLLDHYGVQACILPSGHVAAVTATALVVRAYRPRFGALFILAAASVAAASVFLRYHYTADAVAGALAGWAAACASRSCLAGTANVSAR